MNKQFTIPSDTYSYSDVVRVSVLNEKAKYKEKGSIYGYTSFRTITIWDSTRSISICWSKGCIKDETILAIYVSKEKTMFNTNQYIKDRKVAEKIKEVMKKKLNRF